jgi:hypothetical protein
MPGKRSKHQHTAKANRMAQHIEKSAADEGRYKGREERVAWATVHKEMPNGDAHKKSSKEVMPLAIRQPNTRDRTSR